MSKSTGPSEGSPEIQKRIAQMEPAKARSEFRAQVKRRFTGCQDHGLLVPIGEIHSTRLPQHRRWFTGIMAAAILAFALTWLMQPQPAWQITDADPNGRIVINQAEVRADKMVGELLPGDCYVHHLGPGMLRIDKPGEMTWLLEPGTQVHLRGKTVLSRGAPLSARVLKGVAMGTTGADFPEAGLDFTTRDLSAHVSGTTFGILAGADSTCVCVLEGTVTLADSPTPVPAGTSVTVFLDGPTRARHLSEPETQGLRMTREVTRTP